jgi:cytosine/adenosine deaminase-related metal-dependent hydrolase
VGRLVVSAVVVRCETLVASATSPAMQDAGVVVVDDVVAGISSFSRPGSWGCPSWRCPVSSCQGLVDAHSHLRAVPLQDHDIADAELETWLIRLTTMTPTDAGDEALVASADALRAGVTSVQGVFHSFGAADEYGRDVHRVAEAAACVGLRLELGLGITDQGEFLPPAVARPPSVPGAVADPHRGMSGESFAEIVGGLGELPDRVTAAVAPVAAQWCSDGLLRSVAGLAATGRRVHTHLLESRKQRAWVGESPVTRLARHGLLDRRLSAAHGVWLDDDELQQLCRAGVVLVHCPGSNRRLEVGAAPVAHWLRRGAAVGLGSDSNGSTASVDLFAEMRAALETAEELGDPLTPAAVLEMATVGGAAAIGRGDLGRVARGFRADLIAVHPAAGGQDDVEAVIAHGAAPLVSHVMVDGKRVVVDGRLSQRASDATEAARTRLSGSLQQDARRRRRRQAELSAVEPVLWDLLPSWTGPGIGAS